MNIRPKYGKSCCEEAELTANELARQNAKLSEAEVKIAAQRRLRDSEFEYWSGRAEKAEAERDELQDKLKDAKNQRDHYKERLAMRHAQPKPNAAENRPTLDREAVREVVNKHCGHMGSYYTGLLIDELMELVPAEGWPEWLGPRPEKPNAVRNSNGVWAMDRTLIAADITPAQCDHFIAHHVNTATDYAAVKDAIESEQAATGDEEQRVEEQAKALFRVFYPLSVWEENVHIHGQFRAAIRAGWTPPENEDGNE